MTANGANPTHEIERFLKTGNVGDKPLADMVASADKLVRSLVERDSARAIKYGRAFVRVMRRRGGRTLATALRALAWACHLGGKYRSAEEAYLEARKLLRREPIERARIDRTLLDVYMYMNDLSEAHRRARMAIRTFEGLQAEGDLARARANFANLLHRQDRHREALTLYRDARKYFENLEQDLAAAFCQHNEANTLVQLFEFDSAGDLYRRALDSFERHGYDLHAIGCKYGLAWLAMLAGEYHQALSDLTDCETAYKRASQPREVVLCQLDRAEAYLGLNLFTDSRRAAQEAEKGARKLGLRYEMSKGALFSAMADLAADDSNRGRQSLRRAKKGFEDEENESFSAVVDLLLARFETDGSSRFAVVTEARKRFTRAQLPLWEAICDLQILSERPDQQRVLSRLSKNRAVEFVPHLRARWLTMLGDREARHNRASSARRYWEKACNLLDDVRAKLPPVDLRTGFARHQGEPHLKLTQAELGRDPRRAAAWSERHKTAGLWQTDRLLTQNHPARAKAEASLSQLASQVTAVATRLGERTDRRSAAHPLADRSLERLQERVRGYMIDIDRTGSGRSHAPQELCGMIDRISTRIPILQFHLSHTDLIAFVHYGKDTSFHRYEGGAAMVRELLVMWQFMMESATDRDCLSNEYLRDEAELLGYMSRALLSRIDLPLEEDKLLVMPEGALTGLPWPAIPINGQPLIQQCELVFSPSLRHYMRARGRRSRSERIEVFLSDAADLSTTIREAELFGAFDRKRMVVHRQSCRADWPDKSSADVWHFSGHGRTCLDNPFYSALEMSDGPMFAADFRLLQNLVNTVVLAACRTGDAPNLPGEESTGLVRSILEMGARNVIASHWSVDDSVTIDWLDGFYHRLAGGDAVSTAVRETSLALMKKYPSAYHWAPFAVFGAG